MALILDIRTILLVFFGIICTVLANTNSQDICQRDPSDTTASKTPGDNGFRIKIAGRPQPESYSPGQVYTITINGTYPRQKLLGFMLVAVPVNAQDETTAMGTFQHFNHGLTKFAENCPHVVTHTYKHPKAGVEVLWTAPPAGTGCVEFRATVLEYKDIWYKDDGALTRRFCEDSVIEGEMTSDDIPDCCACGTAKYQMTFQGLWSRQTHPKDFPTHRKLLHWSNIVGASHSKNYFLWQYGAYASRGIKEVCEYGYSRTLEREMRQHSHDVRTVVKTPGIWWSDPEGLVQSRWARFSVDKKNHLLTMLTMLGPSPDWCAGVSALNLCLTNCSWATEMSVDVFPWDAGTDDGRRYLSANRKSDPQEKIHRITNTFPNDPESPFFGDEPIKPLARITLRRIYPKPDSVPVCTDTEINGTDDHFEQGEFGDNGDMEMKKRMMEGKCAVSEWKEWSECSVTCGVGEKIRKRMYLNPMMNEDMCGFPEMEVENCIGIENECNEEPPETVDMPCAVSRWSDWSPCSVTCGKGLKERRRYYLKDMDKIKCDRVVDMKEMCVADIMDCELAKNMKNFTAICALDKDVGPCRGSFTRWHYDIRMGKCLPFTYGGCRGNNNRFRSEEECNDMCMETMRHKKMEAEITVTEIKGPKALNLQQDNGDAVDCMVTPWGEWSECSATCGRNSFKYANRMVKREPENGGKKCPKKMEKKRRCKLPKCRKMSNKKPPMENKAVDCVLGDWGPWSECAKTCGAESIQERMRPVVNYPKRNGKPCGPRIERRFCSLPPCDGSRYQTSNNDDRMRQLYERQ